MIGHFDASDGNPKVILEIAGTRANHKMQIPALFDTGHNGSLSLTVLQLIEIGAVLKTTGEVEFANGRKEVVLYFEVKVTIDGTEKVVLASMIESPEAREAIAGLELFSPYIAFIDFKNKRISFNTEDEIKKKFEEVSKNAIV